MSWFSRFRTPPIPEPTAEDIIEEALEQVKDAIDIINSNMPLLAGSRLSLYIDRDFRPARVVLTDWSRTTPTVIHGDQ